MKCPNLAPGVVGCCRQTNPASSCQHRTALLVLTCLTLPNTDASMPTSDRTASRLRPALPVPASMRVLWHNNETPRLHL
jgi:hypothetical protein